MSPRRRAAEDLTPSEYAVAKLVADGLSNAEIAIARGCSVKAVEGHITNAAPKVPGIGRPRVKLTRHVEALRRAS